MKNKTLLVAALLPLFTVACGGAQEDTQPQLTTESSALSSTDPLLGTWCISGWPGCITFYANGTAIQSNYGDVCWVGGETVWSGITAGSTPGTYTGTRHMYGRGDACNPRPEPRSGTIVLNGNEFTEVAGNFTATWHR